MLNRTRVGEMLKAMEWRSLSVFNMPPRQPNGDVSLPEACPQLEASRARRSSA